jgi:replicative DNA helicase
MIIYLKLIRKEKGESLVVAAVLMERTLRKCSRECSSLLLCLYQLSQSIKNDLYYYLDKAEA